MTACGKDKQVELVDARMTHRSRLFSPPNALTGEWAYLKITLGPTTLQGGSDEHEHRAASGCFRLRLNRYGERNQKGAVTVHGSSIETRHLRSDLRRLIALEWTQVALAIIALVSVGIRAVLAADDPHVVASLAFVEVFAIALLALAFRVRLGHELLRAELHVAEAHEAMERRFAASQSDHHPYRDTTNDDVIRDIVARQLSYSRAARRRRWAKLLGSTAAFGFALAIVPPLLHSLIDHQKSNARMDCRAEQERPSAPLANTLEPVGFASTPHD